MHYLSPAFLLGKDFQLIYLGSGIFAITGFSILVITLLTVSFQAVNAALSNPVKSLKAE